MVVPLMTGLQRVETNIEANARRLELSVAASLKHLEDTWETRFDYMLGVIDRHLKTMDTRLDVYGTQIEGLARRMDASEADRTELRADQKSIRDLINQLPHTEQLTVIKEVQYEVKRLRRLFWRAIVALGAIVLLLVIVFIQAANR
jgi:CHASE3 domain sensor protein